LKILIKLLSSISYTPLISSIGYTTRDLKDAIGIERKTINNGTYITKITDLMTAAI
jgi:hypothetical protein